MTSRVSEDSKTYTLSILLACVIGENGNQFRNRISAETGRDISLPKEDP